MLRAATRDPSIVTLLYQAAAMAKDSKGNEVLENDLGRLESLLSPQILYDAAHKRALRVIIPYATIIETLLGHEALHCLMAPSERGFGNLQPHEFSRTGWRRLNSISAQIAIEQELHALSNDNETICKLMVVLSWTAVALASFMEPGIFVTEADPYLSSHRAEQWSTVSVGRATHEIQAIQADSTISMLRVLREVFTQTDLTAADLMWIADGCLKWAKSPNGLDNFELFLSHRGLDAKRQLAEQVLALPERKNVFLDCLRLPRAVVNRKFVFGSLARSRRIYILDTPNFEGSAWCRKERIASEAMQKLGLVQVQRIGLDQLPAVLQAKKPSASGDDVVRPTYPILQRVLSDLENWNRQPNKVTLSELSLSLDPFQAVEEHLDQLFQDPPSETIAAAKVVQQMFHALSRMQLEDPYAVWCTGAQLAVATLGARTCAFSKLEVRRGIDQMNYAIRQMLSEIGKNALFLESFADFFSVLCSAVLLDLSGGTPDVAVASEIASATTKLTILVDGVLLFDVRSPGPKRDLFLKFVLLLTNSNIGRVGILQNADDPVHELDVDGKSLAVLPCVTVHPGMESLFVG